MAVGTECAVPASRRDLRSLLSMRRSEWDAHKTEHNPFVGTTKLLLESFDEPAQQLGPDLILANLVLNPVFEIRIVIDFHDDETGVGLLDVDAIESVAYRPRGAHRDVDQFGRRLIDFEGLEATFTRGAVGAVLHDLPVAARHAVLA